MKAEKVLTHDYTSTHLLVNSSAKGSESLMTKLNLRGSVTSISLPNWLHPCLVHIPSALTSHVLLLRTQLWGCGIRPTAARATAVRRGPETAPFAWDKPVCWLRERVIASKDLPSQFLTWGFTLGSPGSV